MVRASASQWRGRAFEYVDLSEKSNDWGEVPNMLKFLHLRFTGIVSYQSSLLGKQLTVLSRNKFQVFRYAWCCT